MHASTFPWEEGPFPGGCVAEVRVSVRVCVCVCVHARGPRATGWKDYKSTRSSSLKNPALVVVFWGGFGVSGSIARQDPVFHG